MTMGLEGAGGEGEKRVGGGAGVAESCLLTDFLHDLRSMSGFDAGTFLSFSVDVAGGFEAVYL